MLTRATGCAILATNRFPENVNPADGSGIIARSTLNPFPTNFTNKAPSFERYIQPPFTAVFIPKSEALKVPVSTPLTNAGVEPVTSLLVTVKLHPLPTAGARMTTYPFIVPEALHEVELAIAVAG